MQNKKTMIVKIDWGKQKVLNENLNFIITDFIKKNIDFELVLIDAENYVIDSHINTIVNQYIKDCKKKSRPLAVEYKFTSEFIENLMKYFNMADDSQTKSRADKITIEIIAPNKRYFWIKIPKSCFSDEKIDDLKGLGKDFIEGGLSTDIIFNYILSPFYHFLYKNDLLNDEELGDLKNYQFGLK